MYLAKISYNMVCFFHSIKRFFRRNYFILLSPTFSFMKCAFGIKCKSVLQKARPPKFHPVFLLELYKFLICFTFKSDKFGQYLREVFVHGCPVVPAPFVAKTVLFYWTAFGLLSNFSWLCSCKFKTGPFILFHWPHKCHTILTFEAF